MSWDPIRPLDEQPVGVGEFESSQPPQKQSQSRICRDSWQDRSLAAGQRPPLEQTNPSQRQQDNLTGKKSSSSSNNNNNNTSNGKKADKLSETPSGAYSAKKAPSDELAAKPSFSNKGSALSTGNINNNNRSQPEREPNLDSGYAWLILIVMFLQNSTIGGSSRVYGLVFANQVAIGYYDREEASWPIATASAVENLAGILTPALATCLSWRQIELLSTLLLITANLGAYFSNSLAVDFLCLGLIQGLALSMGTVLSLAINNEYFERFRTSAYGIAMSGAAFGVLYLIPIVSWLLESYGDFRLVYLALALVFMFNLVLVLFIKPRKRIPEHRRRRYESQVQVTGVTSSESRKKNDESSLVDRLTLKKTNDCKSSLDYSSVPVQATLKLQQQLNLPQAQKRRTSILEYHLERKSSVASVSMECHANRESTWGLGRNQSQNQSRGRNKCRRRPSKSESQKSGQHQLKVQRKSSACNQQCAVGAKGKFVAATGLEGETGSGLGSPAPDRKSISVAPVVEPWPQPQRPTPLSYQSEVVDQLSEKKEQQAQGSTNGGEFEVWSEGESCQKQQQQKPPPQREGNGVVLLAKSLGINIRYGNGSVGNIINNNNNNNNNNNCFVDDDNSNSNSNNNNNEIDDHHHRPATFDTRLAPQSKPQNHDTANGQHGQVTSRATIVQGPEVGGAGSPEVGAVCDCVSSNVHNRRGSETKTTTRRCGAEEIPIEQQQASSKFDLNNVTKLLRLPYLHCVWIMLTLYYLISRVFIIILVDFADDHGLEFDESRQLLNCWSFGELFGRIVLGSLIDLQWVSVRTCTALTCSMLAASILTMVLVESFLVYAICSTLIAALVSLEYMLINVLMIEYMGKAQVTSCYSVAAFISSLILFGRPALIGMFRDHLGSYDGLLVLLAGVTFTYALLFYLLEPLLVRFWPKCGKSTEVD